MNRKTAAEIKSILPALGPQGMLALSMLFSCLLLLVRILYTGTWTYSSLGWNLFLAALPYGWTKLALFKRIWYRKRVLMFLHVSVWLLLIPNSFYILTDLFHLADWYNDFKVPGWYDLIVIVSFAWNGLLLGMMSVRQMEIFLEQELGRLPRLLFLCPVMLLNGLGVYVGRYLRFNSWDVITSPVRLISDIAGIFIHPMVNHYAWGMIICFSALMTLMYLTIKKIADAIG
jgi:uncharacterized membrane protein